MSDTEAVAFIRSLKPALSRVVWKNKDRVTLCKTAAVLRASGAINFAVVTRTRPEGGFLVGALKEK